MGLGNASAATIFYDNESSWLAAVNAGGLSASLFDTTSSNIALADQVALAPGDGTNLGTTLTFTGANTGFGFDFEVSSPLGGPALASIFYAGTVGDGAFSPAAANGNDNFKIVLSGDSPVFGFAFTITGNASSVDDSTNVENFSANTAGASGPLPLTSGMVPSVFLGFISDDAFTLILADESQTDGDTTVLYSNLRFATVVPEPSTGLLLCVGLVVTAASRRRSPARLA